MGTKICWSEAEVADGFEYVVGRSKVLFKDSGVFMERYYPECHHIEVQVFARICHNEDFPFAHWTDLATTTGLRQR